MSETELSKRSGAPPQRTINEALKAIKVPGLTFVHQISVALGVHAWELFREKPKRQEIPTEKVSQLRPPMPKIFTSQHDRTRGQTTKRNKSRA